MITLLSLIAIDVVHNKLPHLLNKNQNINKTIKNDPVFPSKCYYNITGHNGELTTVYKGYPLCIASRSDSIIIVGDPVRITGYYNERAVFSGTGIAASMGDSYINDNYYYFMIEATETQNIYIYNFDLPEKNCYFFTTRSKVRTFNLLQNYYEGNDGSETFKYAYLIKLGRVYNDNVNIKTSAGTMSYASSNEDNDDLFFIKENSAQTIQYKSEVYLVVGYAFNNSGGSVLVNIEGGNNGLKNTLNGYIAKRENYVYTYNDFEGPYYEVEIPSLGPRVGIIVGCVITIATISSIVACFFEKRGFFDPDD